MTRAARRRRLLAAAAGLLVLGVAGAVVYAAWPRGVEVAPPTHQAACEPAAAAWPATVAGKDRRRVRLLRQDSRDADVRAWGDPAIVATCGWPALAPTDKECLDVDGVDWVVEPLSDGARFTTYGRDPAIEVLVPHAYAPEPLLLPAFGGAAKALPANGRTCQ